MRARGPRRRGALVDGTGVVRAHLAPRGAAPRARLSLLLESASHTCGARATGRAESTQHERRKVRAGWEICERILSGSGGGRGDRGCGCRGGWLREEGASAHHPPHAQTAADLKNLARDPLAS